MEINTECGILDVDFLLQKGFCKGEDDPGYFIEYVNHRIGFIVKFLYQTNEVSIERWWPNGEHVNDYIVYRFKLLELNDLSFIISRLTLLHTVLN